MQLGIIGVGPMGSNIACRLLRHGHAVVAHHQSSQAVSTVVAEGASAAEGLGSAMRKGFGGHVEPTRSDT
jgi:6-phosphogluconate dehydrogenase